MTDWLYLAALTAGVMILVGCGVHFGERMIDRALGIQPEPEKPIVKPLSRRP
jgi:hypothetical protein